MPNADSAPESIPFRNLGLAEALLATLTEVGYETPSPIQAATIPPMLAGRDVIGQAQTGTGKTAAFALPILSRLDLSETKPQALVLAPTRELAIQVAEAFQRYAAKMPGFHVLPIYGGQSYERQMVDAFPEANFGDALTIDFFAHSDHLFTHTAVREKLTKVIGTWIEAALPAQA